MEDSFYHNSLRYLEQCKIAFASRFAAPFICAIGSHVLNLENRKREFYLEHGRLGNLRTHVFFCAPPGYMKTLMLQKFIDGPTSIAGGCEELQVGFEGAMCLPAGQQVQLSNGLRMNIESFKGGEEVICIDDEWKQTSSRVSGVFKMKGNVLQITLRSGRIIQVTDNHPLLTANGWMEAGKLNVGSRVAIIRSLDIKGGQCDKAYRLGQKVHMKQCIPDVVFTWGKESVREFLRGLFDGGSYQADTFSSPSENLVRGAQTLLVRNGIQSHVWFDQCWKIRVIDSSDEKSSRVYWDEIVKVESLGIMDVFNLSVERWHNFIVSDVITHNTEAGFSGTIKVVNGEPVKQLGAAYDHREGILGIDEFAVLTNAMKQEHSVNLDSAMLTALDSGYVVKRLALGKIQYMTDLTLFTGSQPARFNLTSGLGRRFIFIYFVPSRAESNEIKDCRRLAKTAFPSTTVLYNLKANLKKMIDTAKTIERISFDKSIYSKLDRLSIPHFEEMLYERIAAGYTMALQNGGDKVLSVSMDMELGQIFKQIYDWRQDIKKGAETTEVYNVVREMDMCTITQVKNRLTDFGLEYEQSSYLLERLRRQGRIEFIKEKSGLRGGRPATLIKITERDDAGAGEEDS